MNANWKPIETAPKSTDILVQDVYGNMFTVFFDPNDDLWYYAHEPFDMEVHTKLKAWTELPSEHK